jgi:thymidylate kinase
MFITFEGIDFCGKSTQVKLLNDYLSSLGKTVKIIREPGGTEISEKIREILLDKKNNKMTIETEFLLFSASRAQLIRERIRPYLNENFYVISDRLHDSSIAYQGFGRGIPVEQIMQISNFAIGNTIPDITFFIDIPVEEAEKRKANEKNVELDRIEVSKNDFFEKVRNGYLFLSGKEKRFRKIDGLLSIESIHKLIIKELEDYAKD